MITTIKLFDLSGNVALITSSNGGMTRPKKVYRLMPALAKNAGTARSINVKSKDMKIILAIIWVLLTFTSHGQSNKKLKIEPGIYKLHSQKYSDGQTDTIFSGFELM